MSPPSSEARGRAPHQARQVQRLKQLWGLSGAQGIRGFEAIDRSLQVEALGAMFILSQASSHLSSQAAASPASPSLIASSQTYGMSARRGARSGYLIKVEGELSRLMCLIEEALELGSTELSTPEVLEGDQGRVWLRLTLASSLSLSQVGRLSQRLEVALEIFRSLETGEADPCVLWAPLASGWTLHPLVDDPMLRELRARLSGHVLLVSDLAGEPNQAQVDRASLPHLWTRDAYLRSLADQLDQATQDDRSSEDLLAHSPPLSPPTISWSPRRLSTLTLGALFSSSEVHLEALSTLTRRRGMKILSVINVWEEEVNGFAPQVAWTWSDPTLTGSILSSLSVAERHGALSASAVRLFTPYTELDPRYSARIDERDGLIWLPSDYTLTPLPPPETLRRWCGLVGDGQEGSLWLIPRLISPQPALTLVNAATTQLALMRAVSTPLINLIDVTLQLQSLSSIDALSPLRATRVTLDASAGSATARRLIDDAHSEPDSAQRGSSRAHVSAETTENSAVLEAPQQEMTPQQEESEQSLSAERAEEHVVRELQASPSSSAIVRGADAERALRAQLREVTHQQSAQEIGPRERARRQLNDLRAHTPQLISGALSAPEWLKIAQALWLTEAYPRALDALTWALIEHIVQGELTRHDHREVHELFIGWASRLQGAPSSSLSEFSEWQRQALLSLTRSPLDQGGVTRLTRDVARVIDEVERHTQPRMHLHWLIYFVWVQDSVSLQRGYELSAGKLIDGLRDDHLEPALLKIIRAQVRDHDQGGPLTAQLYTASTPSARMRAWGSLMISIWRGQRESRLAEAPERDLIHLDILGVSLEGMSELLGSEMPEAHALQRTDQTSILSEGVTAALRLHYLTEPPPTAQERALARARINSEETLSLWRQSSSMDQTPLEQRPLSVSKRRALDEARGGGRGQAETGGAEPTYIPLAELSSPLRELLRRMRSVIRNYYSLREVTRRSVSDAAQRGDRRWLLESLRALERWSDDLEQLPTAPHDLAPLLELERIRVWCALADQGDVTPLVDHWVMKWLEDATRASRWSTARLLGLTFATDGIDALSALLTPETLIALGERVRVAIRERSEQGSSTDHRRRVEVEYRILDHLICARVCEAVQGGEARRSLEERSRQGAQALLYSILDWMRAPRQTKRLHQSSPSPLAGWPYQLMRCDARALEQLVAVLSEVAQELNTRELFLLWCLLEDALCSTPLFEEKRDDALAPWLRTRERALREAWRILVTPQED